MMRLLLILLLASLPAWAEGGPSPPGNLEERLAAAFQALESKDYPRAIALFEDVAALDWRNFQAHFGLGLAYFRSGALKEALFEFRQLAKLYPERFEGWYNLGVTQARLKDWKGATESLARALAVGEKAGLPPATLRPAYLALADAYRRLDNPSAAAEVLSRAYKALPGDPEVALLLADALVAAGKGEDALPYLYEVLAGDRGNVTASLLLADVLVDQGLSERALRELDRSIAAAKTDTDRARLIYKKALILAGEGGKRAEVEALLEEAIALDPGLWQAQYDVGRLKLALGDAKGALRAFMLAYQANPNDPRVLLGLAAAYDALGKAADAYRVAKLAVRKAGAAERIEALFLLGKNAYRAGRYSEAVEALKQVVAERKSDAEAWLWLGLALYAVKDYGQAVSALERAAELDGRVEVLEALGAAYLAARRFSDAERVYTEVVLKAPERAEAWYHLGWALKALGRDSEAKRAWKKALELGYKPAQGLVR